MREELVTATTSQPYSLHELRKHTRALSTPHVPRGPKYHFQNPTSIWRVALNRLYYRHECHAIGLGPDDPAELVVDWVYQHFYDLLCRVAYFTSGASLC